MNKNHRRWSKKQVPSGAVYLILLSLFTLSSSAISVEEGLLIMKLKPCPNSPNCVSSQSDSNSHKISPLSYQSSAKEALEKIKKTILAFPNSHLFKENDQYLHIVFKTRFLKFVDDVEILVDASEKVIHLRSASRTGYWDFGTNRRRIKQIKKKFIH